MKISIRSFADRTWTFCFCVSSENVQCKLDEGMNVDKSFAEALQAKNTLNVSELHKPFELEADQTRCASIHMVT